MKSNEPLDSEYLIDITKLDAYIKGLPYGTKTKAREAAADVLFRKLDYNKDPLRSYNHAKKRQLVLRVPKKIAGMLVDNVVPVGVAEPEKLLAVWAPESRALSRTQLSPRDAELGEIQITRESSQNLLDAKEFKIASRFASVHVDEVRFFQNTPEGPSICEGQYLRIEIPSGLHGAVILPVDHETGDVLLVTQYRHAAQRFLTECPRGFGHIGADRSEVETARRELLEETGRLPVRTSRGVERLHRLRSSYTDTGKLWEKPSFFLAYVSRSGYADTVNAWNPAMEDPIWVRLEVFVQALYSDTGVSLERSDFEYVCPPRHLHKMRGETAVSEGVLMIEDAFTIQAGLLALPLLEEEFGPIRKH